MMTAILMVRWLLLALVTLCLPLAVIAPERLTVMVEKMFSIFH